MTPEELAQFDGPDNPDITPDEQMWRRIIPRWIVKDEAHPGGSRLSTAAYEESKNPPSPCSLIRAVESAPERLRKSPDHSVGAVAAGAVRRAGFRLVRDEDPDEPGHHHMVGPNHKRREWHVRLALADATEWIAGPQWGPGIPPPTTSAQT
jgi:hypothetical protein